MRPIENYYETVTNFNFITKYLHNNKYRTLKKILNKEKKKLNIIDIGCGTCNVFKELNKEFIISYIGVDVDRMAIDISKERFKFEKNFQIFCNSMANFEVSDFIDLRYKNIITCFDTIEHMSFNEFKGMIDRLSNINVDHIYINLPIENGLSILIKNLGSFLMRYRRHKEYSLSQTFFATLSLFKFLPEHNKKHLGFNWKKIYNIIIKKYDVKIYTSPIVSVPLFISPSIFLECRKKK